MTVLSDRDSKIRRNGSLCSKYLERAHRYYEYDNYFSVGSYGCSYGYDDIHRRYNVYGI
jgi:hypothetical protein